MINIGGGLSHTTSSFDKSKTKMSNVMLFDSNKILCIIFMIPVPQGIIKFDVCILRIIV